jgi:hypothetical protein
MAVGQRRPDNAEHGHEDQREAPDAVSSHAMTQAAAGGAAMNVAPPAIDTTRKDREHWARAGTHALASLEITCRRGW